MEIYLDILFLENIVMNFLILLVTAKLLKLQTVTIRIFLASIAGALYVVLLILCPGIKGAYTVLAKVLLSILIIGIAFSPGGLKAFIKTIAIFYLSTFIFAGAAFAFLYFNQSGGFVKNGIVYVFWESKWTFLILSSITVGIIIKIFWEVIKVKFLKEKLMIPLKIFIENKSIHMPALLDTGNSLYEPLTNTPVIVVEFMAIRDILPLEIKSIFENSTEEDLNSVTRIVSHSTWFPRFRLIPFTSLGKENGMLIGFKPDFIEIGEEQSSRGVSNVIVGIYNKALSKNEKYHALLNPELFA